jgi:hypothetical protein
MPVNILLADAHHELSWLGTRCVKGGFFEVLSKFYCAIVTLHNIVRRPR